jgi:hypothetical protein
MHSAPGVVDRGRGARVDHAGRRGEVICPTDGGDVSTGIHAGRTDHAIRTIAHDSQE